MNKTNLLAEDKDIRMLMRLALKKMYPSASLSFIDNQMMVMASPLGATPAAFREPGYDRCRRISPPLFGSGPGGWSDAFKESVAQPRSTSTRKEDLPRAVSRPSSPMDTNPWGGSFAEAGSFLYKRAGGTSSGFFHRQVDMSEIRMDISGELRGQYANGVPEEQTQGGQHKCKVT